MNHTRCYVDNRKNGVASLAVARHLGEAEDPVHADRLPFPHLDG